MNLSEWQKRLEEHFRTLRGRRTAEVGEQPVFALEHGLSEADVADLAEGVRAHIRETAPSWEHRLPWTVYAAEFGYLYAGDEYWQTFEERTPRWVENDDRHWVRRCFRDFQKRYGGAEPTGRWARHFSIICWPITHAILPQDLQRQLAKLLYELRHVTSSEALASPRHLGELIANRSWGTSSRFQQLAQEPLLVGQVAAALLLQGEQLASSLILPSTLTRIGKDLDRERRARAWMRGARETARRQLRLSGAAGPGRAPSSDDAHADGQYREQAKLGIEPRLLLRPCADDEDGWDVLVELPDFSHVSARFPELRATLLGSRCRVAGSSGRPQARGWFLYGPQRVLLRRWPSDDEGLLKFEQPSPELDYLLKTECLLRPRLGWLFKVASDRLANELRGTHVRPGQQYVLVRKDALGVSPHPAVRPARLSCEGVHAVFLDLPEAIPPELDEVLTGLGLSQAGTIRVWPAGLTPARWDGEGGVEWLRTETPCVGLRADHHVEAFVAELGEEAIEVAPAGAGAPVFIELPRLPVGRHTLRVAARGPAGGLTVEPACLDVRIREPRVWSPESGGQGALLVIVDPHAPTLEQLWDGEVSIEVHGPRRRHVDCTLCLYEKGHTTPSIRKRLQRMPLPVTVDDWRTPTERLRQDRKVQNAYDLAHRGEVRFTAGELGAFTLTVEREFAPLRWALQRTRDQYFLRVIDDTGGESAATVEFYAFDAPDKACPMEVPEFCVGKGAAAEGGLYVARAGDHRRAITVVPPKAKSFTELRVDPRLRPRRRRPEELLGLTELVDLWSGARLTGNVLSSVMRRRIVGSMLQELFRLICGQSWGNAEGKVAKYGAKALKEANPEEVRFAEAIEREAPSLTASTPGERAVRFADLACSFLGLQATGHASRHGAEVLPWLAEFALRLASGRPGFLVWAAGHATAGISELLQVPALARAARIMVILVDREMTPTGIRSGFPYDGWGWS